MSRKKVEKGDHYEYIPIKIISEATQNDKIALEYILKRYQPYIDTLASYKARDRSGRRLIILDEDKKQQIEEALILAIRSFEIKQ